MNNNTKIKKRLTIYDLIHDDKLLQRSVFQIIRLLNYINMNKHTEKDYYWIETNKIREWIDSNERITYYFPYIQKILIQVKMASDGKYTTKRINNNRVNVLVYTNNEKLDRSSEILMEMFVKRYLKTFLMY